MQKKTKGIILAGGKGTRLFSVTNGLPKPMVDIKGKPFIQRMLDNPQKKVTILTARKLAFPVRKYLKDTFSMDVYVVALGSNNPIFFKLFETLLAFRIDLTKE